jgi:hypothetical protein
MKTKYILVLTLISAGLLAGTSAYAAGGRGGGGGGGGRGPSQAAPVRDGSGKSVNNRGNPNSTGTPVRDGSGKATAPGKGAKDGTGNQANCPNVPAP